MTTVSLHYYQHIYYFTLNLSTGMEISFTEQKASHIYKLTIYLYNPKLSALNVICLWHTYISLNYHLGM